MLHLAYLFFLLLLVGSFLPSSLPPHQVQQIKSSPSPPPEMRRKKKKRNWRLIRRAISLILCSSFFCRTPPLLLCYCGAATLVDASSSSHPPPPPPPPPSPSLAMLYSPGCRELARTKNKNAGIVLELPDQHTHTVHKIKHAVMLHGTHSALRPNRTRTSVDATCSGCRDGCAAPDIEPQITSRRPRTARPTMFSLCGAS